MSSKKHIKKFDLWERDKKQCPYDWSGNDLDPSVLDRLREGDIVRLLLEAPNGGIGWEKIYFEIVSVQYYQKKSKQHRTHRPRKFQGRAMDTYGPSDRFVKTGEVISFWRKNVLEVPGWVGEKKMMPQQCKELIEKHLKSHEEYLERELDRNWQMSRKERRLRECLDFISAVFSQPTTL